MKATVTRASLIALTLAACTQAAPAQDSLPARTTEPDLATRIAERDLSEFKAMLPGLYTNEEQTYFQGELNAPEAERLPRIDLQITPNADGFTAATFNPKTGRKTQATLSYRVEDGHIRSREVRDGQPDCERTFTRHFESFQGVSSSENCDAPVFASQKGFIFGSKDTPFRMDRAAQFTCWVAPQKADGTFGFVNDVQIHDGGGKVWVEGDDFETIGIRLRHVRWPAGNNRHSLVLYVHKGDDVNWERAESYAWTSPDEPRIGMNLRWAQVSCTRGENGITPSINFQTGSGK